MPAQAGIHAETAVRLGACMDPSLRWGDGRRRAVRFLAAWDLKDRRGGLRALVMPAKAGIHAEAAVRLGGRMDPSLRWGDGWMMRACNPEA
jgi:hypothetical protein